MKRASSPRDWVTNGHEKLCVPTVQGQWELLTPESPLSPLDCGLSVCSWDRPLMCNAVQLETCWRICVTCQMWLSVHEENYAKSWCRFYLLDQNLITLHRLEDGHCHTQVPQRAGSITALCFWLRFLITQPWLDPALRVWIQHCEEAANGDLHQNSVGLTALARFRIVFSNCFHFVKSSVRTDTAFPEIKMTMTHPYHCTSAFLCMKMYQVTL